MLLNSTKVYPSLHNKLFNLPARGACSNGIFTSPPWNLQVPSYQDNFVQGMYVDLSKLLEEPFWSVEDDIKQSLSFCLHKVLFSIMSVHVT
jgi:hypothetical protein